MEFLYCLPPGFDSLEALQDAIDNGDMGSRPPSPPSPGPPPKRITPWHRPAFKDGPVPEVVPGTGLDAKVPREPSMPPPPALLKRKSSTTPQEPPSAPLATPTSKSLAKCRPRQPSEPPPDAAGSAASKAAGAAADWLGGSAESATAVSAEEEFGKLFCDDGSIFASESVSF